MHSTLFNHRHPCKKIHGCIWIRILLSNGAVNLPWRSEPAWLHPRLCWEQKMFPPDTSRFHRWYSVIKDTADTNSDRKTHSYFDNRCFACDTNAFLNHAERLWSRIGTDFVMQHHHWGGIRTHAHVFEIKWIFTPTVNTLLSFFNPLLKSLIIFVVCGGNMHVKSRSAHLLLRQIFILDLYAPLALRKLQTLSGCTHVVFQTSQMWFLEAPQRPLVPTQWTENTIQWQRHDFNRW